MPHQCTECARTFPDGSKEMLSGCPDCGGNKFQFKPSDAVDVGAGGGAGSGGAGGGGAGGGGAGSGVADGSSPGGDGGAMSRAKATVRDLMGRGEGDDGPGSTVGETPNAGNASANTSDASAGSSDASAGPSDATSSTASESGSSTSAAGDSSGPDGVDADRDRVTPSESGEWPKSATEEYDTPAEKARRRDPQEESVGAGESTTSERSVGTSGAGEPSTGAAGESTEPEASADASESASEDESITAQMGETEDDAQRSARSDVVSPDELPSRESAAPGGMRDDAGGDASSERVEPSERADRPPSSEAADVKDRPSAGDVASEPDDDSPNLDELREELNSQFESIKVLDPGKYELNLMELYDREEYIISLQEDGRYVIEVPESWRGDASPD